jgi:hypothetical protein
MLCDKQRCKAVLNKIITIRIFVRLIDTALDINSRFCQFPGAPRTLATPALELNARKQNKPVKLSVGHRMQQESLHLIIFRASLTFYALCHSLVAIGSG